nr:Trans-aconitate 2-methyltransferase [uncultured bacterium]
MPHEFDGKKYKKVSRHQKEWGNKIISELSLKGTEKILDLGCGDGVLTANLAQLVPNGKVVGVDASEGMIKEAKKIQLENLTFIKADIDNLQLNEKYDIVFSNATLHWVKDHKKLISTLLSLINNGGIVRLNFASDGNCSNFFAVVKNEIESKKYSEYFKAFVWPWYMPKINEYKELLNSFKIQSLEVWEENSDRYFPDKDTIINWVDQPSIAPFLKYINDKELKPEFRNTVVKKVVERTLQSNGTCFETFRRINVRFTKQVCKM